MPISKRIRRKLRYLRRRYVVYPMRSLRFSPLFYRYLNRHRYPRSDIPLVRHLLEHGYAVSSVKELGGDFSALEAYVAALPPLPEERELSKPFLKGLLPRHAPLANPLMAFVLSDPVLDVVNSYLGVWGKFIDFTLEKTLVSGPMPRAHSQRWHRDSEDLRLCKVFIYFSDVDEQSGPFCYVDGSTSRYRHLYGARGAYPPEGEVERQVPSEAVKVLTGKKGTVLFCDTFGLHRGGYAEARERIMLTAMFCTRAVTYATRSAKPLSFHALS